jgi:hypothetical protein
METETPTMSSFTNFEPSFIDDPTIDLQSSSSHEHDIHSLQGPISMGHPSSNTMLHGPLDPRISGGAFSNGAAQMSPPPRSTRRSYAAPATDKNPPKQTFTPTESKLGNTHTVLYAKHLELQAASIKRLEQKMEGLNQQNTQNICTKLDQTCAHFEKEIKKLYMKVDEIQHFIDIVKADARALNIE